MPEMPGKIKAEYILFMQP